MNAATQFSTSSSSQRLAQALLWLVDISLVGVVFLLPLFMGGWHPLGQLIYVLMVATGLSAWSMRQTILVRRKWRYSGVEMILIAGAALLAVQAAALPPHVVAKLSPLASELLPLWSGEGAAAGGFAPWSHISLTPAATRKSLVIWLAHAGLFALIVQRVHSLADVERLLRWAAIAVSGMAILGLAQFLVGNGKFLWVYEDPFRDTTRSVKGMFANENHFAQYLALGVGSLLWWLSGLTAAGSGAAAGQPGASRAGRSKGWGQSSNNGDDEKIQARWRMAVYTALGAVAFAGLLTFSRGGVLVLFLAGASAVALFAGYGAFGRKALLGLGAAALVVVAAMFIYGYGPLAKQLATIGAEDHAHVDGARLRLWAADMQAFARSPLLGTGAGTHAEVYQTFFPHYASVEYSHAESGYVQVLMETGLAGAAIVLFLWAFVFGWTYSTIRKAADARMKFAAIAIASAILVSVVQSIWDYVWFAPACMSLLVIFAACACRLWQIHQETTETSPPPAAAPSRFSWAVASVAFIGLGFMLAESRLGAARAAVGWEQFLALQKVERELGQDVSTDVLIDPLAEALRHQPEHARAHVRLAAACLRKFEEQQQQSEVPMPLSQIRDAARASNFATKEAQDKWLANVVGENRRWLDDALKHSQQALLLCPLQGEAYTLLAELSFLEGPQAVPQNLLMQQALRVRPYDAHVRFAAGRDAALAGEMEQAIEHWKTAFHHDPRYRRFIIAAVAPSAPAEQMLSNFEPSLDETKDIYDFYRAHELNDQAAVVARRLASQIEQQAATSDAGKTAKIWHQAYGLYSFLGDHERALACARQAAGAAPLDYTYHRDLAAALLAVGQHAEAVEVIRWCRQRRRDDPQLERLWEIAKRGPTIAQPADENTASPATDSALR